MHASTCLVTKDRYLKNCSGKYMCASVFRNILILFLKEQMRKSTYILSYVLIFYFIFVTTQFCFMLRNPLYMICAHPGEFTESYI